MDKAPKVNLQSTSHYFLEGLNELGIEHLFCNFGTDHAPLIEEMARWQRMGRSFPNTLSCPHENTAMHMAAGYALVTGPGQAVLVHVDAGNANRAMGTHNLRPSRTPGGRVRRGAARRRPRSCSLRTPAGTGKPRPSSTSLPALPASAYSNLIPPTSPSRANRRVLSALRPASASTANAGPQSPK